MLASGRTARPAARALGRVGVAGLLMGALLTDRSTFQQVITFTGHAP
jgi:hypothetical protein